MIKRGTTTASAVRFISRLMDTKRIDTEAPLKKLSESHRKLCLHISNGLESSSKLTAVAINQLFRRKYTTANKRRPGNNAGSPVAASVSGGTPVTRKNSCAASQIESAGAVILNNSL